MPYSLPDIDIDFADRNDALNDLIHIPASIIKDGDIKKHNTGVYCQNVPIDPVTNFCSLDYEVAQKLGYFKIDFLNLHVYENVRDCDHLDKLCNMTPVWELLEDQNTVDDLFHLKGNFDIVQKLKPRSIDDLAIVLAIKIPCKRYLINRSWSEIRQKIWLPEPNGEFQFKRAHAFSYAQVVMIQMNTITERQSLDFSN